MLAERLAATAAVGLVVAAARMLPVLEDEAYYWTWSRALAVHYYDHPPVIAWMIRVAQEVLRDRFLALRAVSLTCMGVTLVAVVLTARHLARAVSGEPALVRRAASRAGWGLATSLLFAVALLPATPDGPLAALVAVAGYAATRATTPGAKRGWWPVAGAAIGAAGLAKLPAGIVVVGAVAGILSTPFGRRAWRTPEPIWGVAVGAAPLVAWWLAADGVPPAVAFQASRVTSGAERWLTAGPMTAGAVLLMVGAAVTGAGLRAAGGGKDRATAERALLGGAGAVVAACALAVGWGSGELNWLLPVLVCAAPVAGVRAAMSDRGAGYLRWCGVQGAVAAAVLVHVVHPVWPVPGPRDRTLRAAGWAKVADIAGARADEAGADLILTDRYQAASLLRFYQNDRWPVGVRHPRRKSQYDLWPVPTLCAGRAAVVVGPSPRIQPGLVIIAPSSVVARGRGDRVVATAYVTPVRAEGVWGPGPCPGPEERR